MENTMIGGQLEFGSSTKTAAMPGRCVKVLCHVQDPNVLHFLASSILKYFI
jgi:hypothetical protein